MRRRLYSLNVMGRSVVNIAERRPEASGKKHTKSQPLYVRTSRQLDQGSVYDFVY